MKEILFQVYLTKEINWNGYSSGVWQIWFGVLVLPEYRFNWEYEYHRSMSFVLYSFGISLELVSFGQLNVRICHATTPNWIKQIKKCWIICMLAMKRTWNGKRGVKKTSNNYAENQIKKTDIIKCRKPQNT